MSIRWSNSILLFLIILLGGCIPGQPQSPTIAAESKVQTPDLNYQFIPSPSPTLTATMTTTPILADTSILLCQPDSLEVSTIVDNQVLSGLVCFRFHTGLIFPIVDEQQNVFEIPMTGSDDVTIHTLGISPSGDSIAIATMPDDATIQLVFFDDSLREVILTIELTGDLFTTAYEENAWAIHNIRWINDQWLYADLYNRIDPEGNVIERILIDLEMSNIVSTILPDSAPIPSPQSSIVISPDMQRAIYVTGDYEYYPQNVDLVLIDFESGEVLWRYEDIQDIRMIRSAFWSWHGQAAWSPDSSHVAFIDAEPLSDPEASYSHNGVFLLGRNGESLRRITSFSDMIFDYFNVYHLSWSSDSQRLAFITELSIEEETNSTNYLFIYDFTVNILSCVTEVLHDLSTYSGLVWSPSSSLISYRGEISFGEMSWRIVDLDSGTTYAVNADVNRILGWSDSFRMDDEEH